MYKIAICDDDKRYRKTIREIVEHENSLHENEIRFYEYESGNELLKHTDILHAGAVAVAQQVGGLVQHRNVFVLIDHLDRRLAARRLFGRDHRLFGEELIVDIQLDHITAAQPGVRFTALAVHLNALVAETFIQQAARHVPGYAFHKAGKPHALVVCGGSKLFHKIVPFVG